jgi:hypothetical protein
VAALTNPPIKMRELIPKTGDILSWGVMRHVELCTCSTVFIAAGKENAVVVLTLWRPSMQFHDANGK